MASEMTHVGGPVYRYNADWVLREVSIVSWDARISTDEMNTKIGPGWRIEEIDDYRSAGPGFRSGRLINATLELSDRADTDR